MFEITKVILTKEINIGQGLHLSHSSRLDIRLWYVTVHQNRSRWRWSVVANVGTLGFGSKCCPRLLATFAYRDCCEDSVRLNRSLWKKRGILSRSNDILTHRCDLTAFLCNNKDTIGVTWLITLGGGEVQNRRWVLGCLYSASRKMQFFFHFFCLYTTKTILIEIIFFYFTFFNSVAKK